MSAVPGARGLEGAGGFILRCAWVLPGLTVLGLVFEALTPRQPISPPPDGGLIGFLGGAAGFTAEVAAQAGWLVLPAIAVSLLIRRLLELAAYVATVWVGMALLALGGAHLARSSLMPTGAGSGGGVFSSGSIQLVVTCGALLLVFLPAVPRPARAWTVSAAIAFVVIFETIRVAAGAVSFDSVLGGGLLGLGWLGCTLWAFRHWQQALHSRFWWPYGPSARDRSALAPAPAGDRALPGGRASITRLAGIWLAVASAVTGGGFLITNVLTPVQRLDLAVVHWLAESRTDTLNALAAAAGAFGTTAGIIGVLIVAAPIASAITRRSAPAVFMLASVLGETALYLMSGLIVSRPRPDVDHLSEGLPPTSSFPSGHVAAAVVMYGSLALLVAAWSRSRLRYLGFVLAPVIVLGVALSRMYWGVHYPTDTLASVIFASVWVAACWRHFQPARGAPERHRTAVTDSGTKVRTTDPEEAGGTGNGSDPER